MSFPFRAAGEGAEKLNGQTGEWYPLVGYKNNRGYMRTFWKDGGKRRYLNVHTVVWRVHRGDVPKGLEIDHINRDKTDNRISNLRLVTHAENIRFAWDGSQGICKPDLETKLPDHRRRLIAVIPSTADWDGLASRWGVTQHYLIQFRHIMRKNAGLPRGNGKEYLAGLLAVPMGDIDTRWALVP